MNTPLRRSAVSIAGLFLMAVLIACACGGAGAGALIPTPTAAPVVVPTSTTAPLPTPEKTAESGGDTGGDTGSVPTGDLDGVYTVAGTNPDGSEYTEEMTITEVGDVYNVYWTNGGVSGTAIVFDKYLAVAYPSDSCYTALYAIGEDALIGLWVAPNDTTINQETATFFESNAESDTISLTLEGTNPDGSTYTGGMGLTRYGEVFTVAQQSGDLALSGTGISNGVLFAVSYGVDTGCAVGLYNILPDGTLEGAWGEYTLSDQLGTEIATK
jgi:hypothetical protein